MSYKYETERPRLFTEEGVRTLMKVRDFVARADAAFGACTAGKVIHGDSWLSLAALDFLVEIGEVREITAGASVAGQDRTFRMVRREA